MASHAERARRWTASPLLAVVVATAVLSLAREVLVPLALAVLLAFLLAPLVRRLESLRLGRLVSTLLAVLIGMSVLVGVGWVAAKQAVNLVGKLPEYRDNIARKFSDLRSPPKGDLGKAAKAIKELESEATGKPRGTQEKPPPEPSKLPITPLELVAKLGVPALTLIATVAAVLVIATLMLLQRDDLRDRIVRLVGAGHINLTVGAMEDAAGRVSRYLLTLLVVNLSYGIPLGLALWFLGIPNALLWGMLGTVLRFIPYVGAPAAALMPIALAFAISDGWQLIAWTVGVIVALEFTIAYVVEPWLYGSTTGLSPIAIVLAAVFWTWLWGPIGLLLSTPLTVCIAVLGRHIPQFAFLSVLLSAEPVLPPEVRFYERLVAHEPDEADELAEGFAQEHGMAALSERILLPALGLAKRDRQRDALDAEREVAVLDGVRRISEDLGMRGAPAGTEVPACVVSARDATDAAAAAVLGAAAAREGLRVEQMGPRLATELAGHVAQRGCVTVLVSAVPPAASSNAAYLCRRLREKAPQAKIIVALWLAEGNLERVRRRLKDAGADDVVTSLSEAIEHLRLATPPAKMGE